jgi:hypothetical protein
MDMGLVGIQTAPTAVPPNNLWNRLAERLEQRRGGEGNFLRRGQTVGRGLEMNVAAHRAVGERDKGLAQKHLTQADAKEQSILIPASSAEGGKVQRIGNERIGEQRHAIVQMTR